MTGLASAYSTAVSDGEAVVALLERACLVSAADAIRMAWKSGQRRNARRVRKNAQDAAASAGRGIAWYCARAEARRALLFDNGTGALSDATLALVARDLISREDFDVLSGPWAKVVGPIVLWAP